MGGEQNYNKDSAFCSLRQFMIEDEINAGESNRVEFKEKLPKDPKKYAKTAVAYSNSQGGKLIFGVSDDRRIVGIDGGSVLCQRHHRR